MKGDKLVITEGHIKAAQQIMNLLFPKIKEATNRFIITVAGESGSGKSEIATVLSDLLAKRNIKSVILQQDDYFVYPPRTNAMMRKKEISQVGPAEVHLNLLDQNLKEILKGKSEITKPLVIFNEDKIDKETVNLEGIKVVIVEGTYTTLLENVHQRIFIDRTLDDTRESRKIRARETQDDFLERILQIEHEIISSHKPRADIVITKDYDAVEAQR